MAKIVILGAGVMGSSLCIPAVDLGHDVSLVGTHLDNEIISSIQKNSLHPNLNIKIPTNVRAFTFDQFAKVIAEQVDLLVLGVSSAGIDWATSQLLLNMKKSIPILMITKGLKDNGKDIETLPGALKKTLNNDLGINLEVIAVGGPCIAGELAVRRETMVTFVGEEKSSVDKISKLLSCNYYNIRTSTDVQGVEICAAFKNFYALGVGWAQGYFEANEKNAKGPKMYNLASSIFNQAIHEMNTLVRSLGGLTESAYGLPGVGDLYVTCLAGRNSRMGRLLGLGNCYSYAKSNFMSNDTVEGAELALALGPALRRYWDNGKLPKHAMPLAGAIVNSICDDQPLEIRWSEFAR